MNTKEAIHAMIDGKRVRKINWNKECYVWFNGQMFIDEEEECFTAFTSYSSTWELYEEPKPKQIVVIEKWLCRNNGYFIAQGDKEYLESIYPLSKVKLLDTYEVTL